MAAKALKIVTPRHIYPTPKNPVLASSSPAKAAPTIPPDYRRTRRAVGCGVAAALPIFRADYFLVLHGAVVSVLTAKRQDAGVSLLVGCRPFSGHRRQKKNALSPDGERA